MTYRRGGYRAGRDRADTNYGAIRPREALAHDERQHITTLKITRNLGREQQVKRLMAAGSGSSAAQEATEGNPAGEYVASLGIEGGDQRTGDLALNGTGTCTIAERAGAGPTDPDYINDIDSRAALIVAGLPATGDQDILYVRSSDNTLWWDQDGAGAWLQLGVATPHNLLSATHGDTTPAAVSRGAIITGQGASPSWARLLFPASPTGKFLQCSATDPDWSAWALPVAAGLTTQFLRGDGTWQIPDGTAHNLLSTRHTDTVAAAAVLGDVVAANSTPAWQRVAGNTSLEPLALIQTGTGTVSALPAWGFGLWRLRLRADGTMTEIDPPANYTDLISNRTSGRVSALSNGNIKHDLSVQHKQVYPFAANYFLIGGSSDSGVVALPCTFGPASSTSALPSTRGLNDPFAVIYSDVTLPTSYGGAPGATSGSVEAYARWQWGSIYVPPPPVGVLAQAQVLAQVPFEKWGDTCKASVRLRLGPSDGNIWDTASFRLYWADADGNPITAFIFSGNGYFTPTTSFATYTSAETDVSSCGTDCIWLILVSQGKNHVLETAQTHEFDAVYLAIEQWIK